MRSTTILPSVGVFGAVSSIRKEANLPGHCIYRLGYRLTVQSGQNTSSQYETENEP